jgi:hypothetical protein
MVAVATMFALAAAATTSFPIAKRATKAAAVLTPPLAVRLLTIKGNYFCCALSARQQGDRYEKFSSNQRPSSPPEGSVTDDLRPSGRAVFSIRVQVISRLSNISYGVSWSSAYQYTTIRPASSSNTVPDFHVGSSATLGGTADGDPTDWEPGHYLDRDRQRHRLDV